MKKLLPVLLILFHFSSFGQDLLGKTQKEILNNFNNRQDVEIKAINDTIIKFQYLYYGSTYGKGYMIFLFSNGFCSREVMTCRSETKNYFIAKYVEDGYVVKSTKKETHTYIEFANTKYYIQIEVPKDTDENIICVSYLF